MYGSCLPKLVISEKIYEHQLIPIILFLSFQFHDFLASFLFETFPKSSKQKCYWSKNWTKEYKYNQSNMTTKSNSDINIKGNGFGEDLYKLCMSYLKPRIDFCLAFVCLLFSCYLVVSNFVTFHLSIS